MAFIEYFTSSALMPIALLLVAVLFLNKTQTGSFF